MREMQKPVCEIRRTEISLACEIEGRPGLILVEAKAHKNELKIPGKVLEAGASQNSRANHAQIAGAIKEDFIGLRCLDQNVSITHYQLANRFAFTWKLTTLNVGTVLIYLGFLWGYWNQGRGPTVG